MPATWPASLPQFVLERGYAESLPDQVLESQVDNGPPKVRRRFTKNLRPIQATIECDLDQKATFEFFHGTTLAAGTLTFLWLNPLTQALAEFRFRRPPPAYTPFGSINVAIQMNLWQLVQFAAFRFDSTLMTFDSTEHSFDEANRY